MNGFLRLGTRGSRLALAQTTMVAGALEKAHGWPAGAVTIVPITTTGDVIQDRPLADIGGKALWTKELDRALAACEIDAAVHSMKDVESDRPATFVIAAMLERADVRDRLIGAATLDEIPQGAIVGTCSPRRSAQLKRRRGDLSIVLLRGNVETRLRKVETGEVDATLLAAAGLDRLGIDVGTAIGVDDFLPAPGQAAIGIECRAEDDDVMTALSKINHRDTADCVAIERAFTRALGGSCASPIAALARVTEEAIDLRCEIFSIDGVDVLDGRVSIGRGDLNAAEALASSMLAAAPDSIRRLFGAG